MLPIPGTGKVRHLEENVAAADIVLSDEEFAALDKEGRKEKRGQVSCRTAGDAAVASDSRDRTEAPPSPGG